MSVIEAKLVGAGAPPKFGMETRSGLTYEITPTEVKQLETAVASSHGLDNLPGPVVSMLMSWRNRLGVCSDSIIDYLYQLLRPMYLDESFVPDRAQKVAVILRSINSIMQRSRYQPIMD